MIKLIKLEENDFFVFKSWIKSQDELFQFAGPILRFPITDKQLLDYINDTRRIVFKVVLTDSDEMIGNAELNFENSLPRLSRILIGELKYRNRGFGKLIVDNLLDKLFMDFNFQQADLNVFDWNKAAIKCYENAGFVINPNIVYKHNHNSETWTALNMIISKDNWLILSEKRIKN